MGKLLKLNTEVTIPYENDKSILIKIVKGKEEITSFLPKKTYNFKSNTHWIPESREVAKCRFIKGNDIKDVEVSIEEFIEMFGTIVPEVL